MTSPRLCTLINKDKRNEKYPSLEDEVENTNIKKEKPTSFNIYGPD